MSNHCLECGGSNIKEFEQRVDRVDPTITVAILARCGDCGAYL